MRLFITVILTLLAFSTTPAYAQGICGEREAIVKRLSEKYGETRQSMGLQRNNGVMEIFASEESGTWTILVTLPNGMTCLVAAGEAYDSTVAVEEAPKGRKT
ncbi:MAG: hypothetical protein AAGC92_12470 [Pseudomonadota bacterium]